MTKFRTNSSGATWWPNLQPVQVVPLKSILNYSSWKIYSIYSVNTLGPLCLWQCLWLWWDVREGLWQSIDESSLGGDDDDDDDDEHWCKNRRWLVVGPWLNPHLRLPVHHCYCCGHFYLEFSNCLCQIHKYKENTNTQTQRKYKYTYKENTNTQNGNTLLKLHFYHSTTSAAATI